MSAIRLVCRSTARTLILGAVAAIAITVDVHDLFAQAAPPSAPTPVAPLGSANATFRLNTTSPAATATFDSAYNAFLENHWTRSAAQFKRAFAIDSQLRLARAMELSMYGRGQALADSVTRLHFRNRSGYHIENVLFIALRELMAGRTAASNTMLSSAARVAITDDRLSLTYFRNLARGNVNRIAFAREYRNRQPGSYLAQGFLAHSLIARGDSAEMVTAMNEALRLGPNVPYTHWIAGQALAVQRRYDEAIAHYGHALQRDPAYYQALEDRGRVNLYAGRYADARRDFQQVERDAVFSIDRGVARRAAALTYLHEKNIDESIRQMTAASRQFENEAGWYAQRALTHQHLAVMHAVKKDIAGVERHLLAQKAVYEGRAGSGPLLGIHSVVVRGSAGACAH